MNVYFFFNDTATTEIYTLSLHDALPISAQHRARLEAGAGDRELAEPRPPMRVPIELRQVRPHHFGFGLDVEMRGDRKSTRLNSSHANISYAVFCLKKKNLT